MKLKDLFKKNAKNIETANFKALDLKHQQKISGGTGADTTTTTTAATKHIAGVKYEDIV
jgi:flagellar basal body rod protein FlgB